MNCQSKINIIVYYLWIANTALKKKMNTIQAKKKLYYEVPTEIYRRYRFYLEMKLTTIIILCLDKNL